MGLSINQKASLSVTSVDLLPPSAVSLTLVRGSLLDTALLSSTCSTGPDFESAAP